MTELRRTPQTRLGDRAGRPAVGYLVSSAPAAVTTVAIGVWLADHAATRDRGWWSLLLFGALLAVAPALVRRWEQRLPAVLGTLASDDSDGWDVSRAERALARVDRLFWPLVVFALAFAAVFFVFYATPGLERIALDDTWGRAVTAAVAAWFAYLIGVGLWILIRVVALVAASVASPPVWRPFRRRSGSGIPMLSSFAAWTGAMLGVGSLAVPVWIEAGRGLPPVGALLSAAGTTMFLLMGTAAFLIPQAMLVRFVARERDRSMDELGRVLEQLAAEIVDTGTAWAAGKARKAHATRLVELDAAFRAVDGVSVAMERRGVAPPLLHTVPRALTTVILPVASLVVQAVTS